MDGGGDRWLTFLDELQSDSDRHIKVAEMLTGDLDSISDASKLRLSEMGTEIITTPDQDETDFTKALKLVKTSGKEVNIILRRINAILGLFVFLFSRLIR